MNNQQFGNVPVSRFGSVADELEEINKTNFGSRYDMKDQLQDISEKVEKTIEVNIQLQQKITKLGQAIAELAKEIRAGKIQEPEHQEEQKPGMPAGVPPPPMLDFEEEEETEKISSENSRNMVKQLKLLTDQNMELVNSLKNIDEKLNKGSSKDRIEKALRKAGAI